MSYVQEYKIVKASAKFDHNVFKSAEYLDLSDLKKQPFFQKRGIYVFREVIKIIPSNFTTVSYLDLEGCYYIEKINFKELKSQVSYLHFALLQGNIEFRSIIRTYIYKSRRCGIDIAEYFACDIKVNEFPLCAVLLCFLQGLDYRLQELLKYGFQRIPTAKVVEIYRSGKSNPLYTMCSVFVKLHSHGLYIDLPEPHWEIYKLQRAFLVIEMMYMLCRLQCCLKYQYVYWERCGKLLWNSIPDPYLSRGEIRDILLMLVWEDPFNMIDRMCEKYEEMFPDICISTTKPRPLAHLCRCVIREYMGCSFSLPDGIDELEIPLCLKSYLKLES